MICEVCGNELKAGEGNKCIDNEDRTVIICDECNK